jgi:hypothetical protein
MAIQSALFPHGPLFLLGLFHHSFECILVLVHAILAVFIRGFPHRSSTRLTECAIGWMLRLLVLAVIAVLASLSNGHFDRSLAVVLLFFTASRLYTVQTVHWTFCTLDRMPRMVHFSRMFRAIATLQSFRSCALGVC